VAHAAILLDEEPPVNVVRHGSPSSVTKIDRIPGFTISQWDIWALPTFDNTDPISVATSSDYDERVAQVSPGSRFIACEANPTGQFEIVRSVLSRRPKHVQRGRRPIGRGDRSLRGQEWKVDD
jgi:hypothetical protein